MNTTTIELKIKAEDKEQFLNYCVRNKGPHFIDLENSGEYFCHEKWANKYYDKHFDNEVFVMTVIPVIYELRAINFIADASVDCNIPIKVMVFYQDPGSGEASGGALSFPEDYNLNK